jgi:hypothetical protein
MKNALIVAGIKGEKGKVFRVHVMKASRGSRGIALLVLNLGTRWTSVVNFTPPSLYPRKRIPFPFF